MANVMAVIPTCAANGKLEPKWLRRADQLYRLGNRKTFFEALDTMLARGLRAHADCQAPGFEGRDGYHLVSPDRARTAPKAVARVDERRPPSRGRGKLHYVTQQCLQAGGMTLGFEYMVF